MAGPNGIFVYLPSGCKTTFSDDEFNKPKNRGKDYNPAVVIVTPGKAVIKWNLGQAKSDVEKKTIEHTIQQIRDSSESSIGKKTSIGKWIGVFQDGDPIDISGKGKTLDTFSYAIYREDLELMLIANWPKGSKSAKQSALDAVKSFIGTLEINPRAKPVSTMPVVAMGPRVKLPRGTAVLSDNTSIQIANSTGILVVKAGPQSQRTLTWNGASRMINLAKPDKDFPNPNYVGLGDLWPEHNSVTNAQFMEGFKDFSTLEKADQWIKDLDPSVHMVWTSGGLVAGWSVMARQRLIVVDIWQIRINGQKPSSLPGANDSAVKILGAK